MPRVTREALTRKTVDAAKATGRAYRLRDATVPGLVLRVSAAGAKSWAMVWGRGQEKAFANYPATTLEGAREAARRLSAEIDKHGAPAAVVTPKSELTVADACRDYVTALEKDGRKTASDDAKRRFERCLYGDKLGKVRLKDLHQDHIEAWRDRVEKGDLPPLPVKRGRPPVAKPLARSSINRIRTTLVAALNHAVARRKVSPDLAFEWNAVKPLKDSTLR